MPFRFPGCRRGSAQNFAVTCHAPATSLYLASASTNRYSRSPSRRFCFPYRLSQNSRSSILSRATWSNFRGLYLVSFGTGRSGFFSPWLWRHRRFRRGYLVIYWQKASNVPCLNSARSAVIRPNGSCHNPRPVLQLSLISSRPNPHCKIM